VKLLREEADRDAGDYSFDRGTNHDSGQLISDGGREPRGQTVNEAEDGAEYHSNQGLGHCFSPSISNRSVVLLNVCREIFNAEK
jgi:hypothetical protein